jgi:hypothetical protein
MECSASAEKSCKRRKKAAIAGNDLRSQVARFTEAASSFFYV